MATYVNMLIQSGFLIKDSKNLNPTRTSLTPTSKTNAGALLF